MERSYARLQTRSLETQLAYNAGFETMTAGFTRWMTTKRWALWGGNCPWVSSFWVMHMVEETEHKTVAYDTYMACSGRYLKRAIGVLHGSFHVLGLRPHRHAGSATQGRSVGPARYDARTRERDGHPPLERWSLSVTRHAPRAQPALRRRPAVAKVDWVAAHKHLAPDAPIPLLDTSDPIRSSAVLSRPTNKSRQAVE